MSRQDPDPDLDLVASVKNWLPGSGFVVHVYRSADPDLKEIFTKINTLRHKKYFSSVLFGDDVSCELWHEELIVKSVNMIFIFDVCAAAISATI
jgi:hypothetical protein